MKRAAIVIAILFAAAGVAWLQTPAPAPDLATLMPSGALLYLHAAGFNRLLTEWDASKVKSDWLASDNFAVFAESNLFEKLGGVYSEYSSTLGFQPGLRGIGEIAGGESALALYDIREVQFVYISRIEESRLSAAQLWAARSRFEQRTAAGIPFWLRTDAHSGRTLGFAFTKGLLIVATRDDLIARALAAVAGGHDPSVASERWYTEAAARARTPGELRVVMNLEALLKTSYFRSYWVQRNASDLRQYWTGIADLSRTPAEISESRVLLRSGENTGSGPAPEDRAAAARLAAAAPDDAGLYRVQAAPDPAAVSALILDKLIAPRVQASEEQRYAPAAADLSQTAGSEADLETRIDEPPLPSETTLEQSSAPLRDAISKAGVHAVLQVQSTAPASRTFIRMPCAVVLAASSPWNQSGIETALTGAIDALWTTSGLGAGWQPVNAAGISVQGLNGLGNLYLAIRGDRLYLANDTAMLSSVLHRSDAGTAPAAATYAAAFRAVRERDGYNRLMTALDFSSPVLARGDAASSTQTPAFFSQDMASLAHVLSPITEVRVTRQDDGASVVETVTYTWRR